MFKSLSDGKLLALILFAGFLLRIVSLSQSLWMDESISAYFAKEFSYTSIFSEVIKSDTHPPLYYLVLKLWSSFFGYSEQSLRFPSVVFGCLTVLAIYKIAQKLSNNNQNFKVYAALLASFSPLLIYYSQEARMYSLTTFLVCLTVLFYIQKKWVSFSVSLLFLAFSDYLPLIMLAPLWLHTLFSNEYKPHIRRFVVSNLPLFAFLVIWYPTFKIQSSSSLNFLSNNSGFGFILGMSSLKNLALVWVKFLIGRISFAPILFYVVIVFLVSLLSFYALLEALKGIKMTKLFWLWFLVPILILFSVSFKIPGFSFFRLLFTLPALLLLVAYGFSKSYGKNIFKLFLISQLLFSLVYLFNQNFWREDWKGAVSFVEQRLKTDEVVLVSYPESFTPYNWYAKKEEKVISFQKIERIDYTSLYTLDYLMDWTDPQRKNYQNLEKLGFKNAEVYNFRGVGQVRYWIK